MDWSGCSTDDHAKNQTKRRNKAKTNCRCREAERYPAVKELGGKPARVAEADTGDEATEPSGSKAQSAMQHTSARRRPEITRFKGLGEISPKEFAQFIGKQMRLSKVEYAPRAEFAPILNFQSMIQY